MTATTVDALARRLRARGYFEVAPTVEYVSDGSYVDDDGRTWEQSRPVDRWRVTWAPTGQGGPGGPVRWNPFCTRTTVATTIGEALQEMVELTTPERMDIDSLRSRRDWHAEREAERRRAAAL